MEKIKKYFEFSGTISGLTYFLRNLLGAVLGFAGGYSIGYGMAASEMGLIMLGLVILAPAMWFGATTIYKRANALFPKDAATITFGVIGAQVVMNFTQDSIGPLLNLALLIFGLIMIFKNSGIPSHEG